MGSTSDDDGETGLDRALLQSSSASGTPSVLSSKKKSASNKAKGSAGMAQLSSKNGSDYDTSQRMLHSMSLGRDNPSGRRAGDTPLWTKGFNNNTDNNNYNNDNNNRGTGCAAGSETEWQAAEAGRKTADRIRQEIAREPVLSLANLAGFSEEPGGLDGGSSGGEGSNLDLDENEDDDEEDEEEDELGIPKTIAEIYEVSRVCVCVCVCMRHRYVASLFFSCSATCVVKDCWYADC